MRGNDTPPFGKAHPALALRPAPIAALAQMAAQVGESGLVDVARAETGRDISIVTRRTRTDDASTDPQPEQPADQPARPKAAPRPSLPIFAFPSAAGC